MILDLEEAKLVRRNSHYWKRACTKPCQMKGATGLMNGTASAWVRDMGKVLIVKHLKDENRTEVAREEYPSLYTFRKAYGI